MKELFRREKEKMYLKSGVTLKHKNHSGECDRSEESDNQNRLLMKKLSLCLFCLSFFLCFSFFFFKLIFKTSLALHNFTNRASTFLYIFGSYIIFGYVSSLSSTYYEKDTRLESFSQFQESSLTFSSFVLALALSPFLQLWSACTFSAWLFTTSLDSKRYLNIPIVCYLLIALETCFRKLNLDKKEGRQSL